MDFRRIMATFLSSSGQFPQANELNLGPTGRLVWKVKVDAVDLLDKSRNNCFLCRIFLYTQQALLNQRPLCSMA